MIDTTNSPGQVRLRLVLAVAAYAYELESRSIMSDHEFDRLCLLVDLDIDTHRPEWDAWFRENFDPCTGQWINNHPEHHRLHYYMKKYMTGEYKIPKFI